MAQSFPLKPAIRGLMSMGDTSFVIHGNLPDNSLAAIIAKPGVFSAVVLNLTWAQLQPDEKSLDTSAIDAALATVERYNETRPDLLLSVKLRIWAASSAPDWVKSLGGAPIQIGHHAREISIGRFWSAPYRLAWRSLQFALAEKYDGNPLVREVANTSCTSQTDEPLNLPGAPADIGKLLAAGYTDKAFDSCIGESSADYPRWMTTRVEFAFNPYRRIQSGHPLVMNSVLGIIMRGWRTALGDRAIISCHGLQSPESAQLLPVIDAMVVVGGDLGFQTRAPKLIKWDATIRYGVALKANVIELWQETAYGGFETQSEHDLLAWARLFDSKTPHNQRGITSGFGR
jgi:hypothetical protein